MLHVILILFPATEWGHWMLCLNQFRYYYTALLHGLFSMMMWKPATSDTLNVASLGTRWLAFGVLLAYYAWPRTPSTKVTRKERNPWRQHVHRATRPRSYAIDKVWEAVMSRCLGNGQSDASCKQYGGVSALYKQIWFSLSGLEYLQVMVCCQHGSECSFPLNCFSNKDFAA